MSLKTKISQLIAKGRLRQALDWALEKIESDHDLHSELILLSARLASVEKNERMGLVSSQDTSLEKNKITYALLEVVEEL